MSFEAILWDNDGVLVDTEEMYYEATREILATAGVELTRETYTQVSLTKGNSLLDLATDKSTEERDRLRENRNDRYCELLEGNDPTIDGVRETVERLHGLIRMGIVTTSPGEHFDIIHTSTGLLPYFDFVLKREDYVNAKPDPEPYLEAMKRNGLTAEQCVVVEDSARGLQAAVAAGLPCIVIPTAFSRESDLSAAWRVVENVRDVPRVIGLDS